MRASPLIFVDEADIKRDVYLTNPNAVSYFAVQIYVSILKKILTGQTKEEIKRYCIGVCNDQEIPLIVREMVEKSMSNNDSVNLRKPQKGWVCCALYISLYAFWHYNTFESAMNFVIGEHKGSDTDTNAAITGALFGGYLGFVAISKEEYTSQNIVLLSGVIDSIDRIVGDLEVGLIR